MNEIEEMLSRFQAVTADPAIIYRGATTSYGDLLELVCRFEGQLGLAGCENSVVALSADYSPSSIALLLALWRLGNIVALMTNRVESQERSLTELCQAQWIARVDSMGSAHWSRRDGSVTDPLLIRLRDAGMPGLVIFSSGSTGTPKASVHRALPLLGRHRKRKRCLTTIAFLLFDHIGGLNTLFYVLFNGGRLVIPRSRAPHHVAEAIAAQGVQAMTTSPTFLNLLILSDAARSYDLGSLEIINYGTEPMPDSTLAALHRLLPRARLCQAYGLTETGIVPARSESSDSGWVVLGDETCAVRVVDGMLEIKSPTTMMGYLNAASPFTADGYFRTGDVVVQKGPYVRILGRKSDVINIGGEKVYPAEIENVLRDLPNVADVVVSHERHAIAGQIVKATFSIVQMEALSSFKRRLHEFCRDRLAVFQIPRKVVLTQAALHSERFKKVRWEGEGLKNEI
ncbi:MAG TPA: fatty acid--CoA ligase family protein [Steroidobacteraceae bacterium]